MTISDAHKQELTKYYLQDSEQDEAADLVRFHLALKHDDQEAAKQLLIAAAQANTTFSEDA